MCYCSTTYLDSKNTVCTRRKYIVCMIELGGVGGVVRARGYTEKCKLGQQGAGYKFRPG